MNEYEDDSQKSMQKCDCNLIPRVITERGGKQKVALGNKKVRLALGKAPGKPKWLQYSVTMNHAKQLTTAYSLLRRIQCFLL